MDNKSYQIIMSEEELEIIEFAVALLNSFIDITDHKLKRQECFDRINERLKNERKD